MGCGGTACCRICVFSDCSLWICSGGGSGKQGWGGGGGRRKKGKQGAWRGVRHTHLALQPAQLIAQAVVHLHQLLHFGLGGGQGFLHLQVLLQRDGAVRQVRGVHALCRERGSAPGAGGVGGRSGWWGGGCGPPVRGCCGTRCAAAPGPCPRRRRRCRSRAGRPGHSGSSANSRGHLWGRGGLSWGCVAFPPSPTPPPSCPHPHPWG